MNHLSLFSGIGGFDLAAEWIGWDNVGQVEKDEFCLQVLNKNFPNVQKFTDIKQFKRADLDIRVDIITGGFPCQPFSHAGARRGVNDDRHLWPEMLRVISEFKPSWVVAENVRGLLTIEKGLVFEQILLDLESVGYEVQPVIIPACAVGAPHRRDRIWFIGYADPNKFNRKKSSRSAKKNSQEGGDRQENNSTRKLGRTNKLFFTDRKLEGHEKDDTDATNERLEREQRNKATGQSRQLNRKRRYERPDWQKNWLEVATELCGVDDGLSVELDKFKLSKARHRAKQLEGYGNAIVPQVAYEIFKSIKNANTKMY